MDEMYYPGQVMVLSTRLDRLDKPEAVARLERMLTHNAVTPGAVFTLNPEMLYRSAIDPQVNSLLNSGDLNVADGIGAVWAARRLGTPLPGRLPGIELGESAIMLAARYNVGVYLLGGRQEPPVAHMAAELLSARFPGLTVRGAHHGYFDADGPENDAVIDEINASGAGLLIVCLGSPRQEHWIIVNRHRLTSVRVAMALGGSIDVWAGCVRRAPRIIRRAGFEWLWRIASDPSRLRRAAALPSFVMMTLKEGRRTRKRFRKRHKQTGNP